MPKLKKTLREHYERKREHYGIERPSFYDPDLKRLFSDAPAHAAQPERRHILEPLSREVRRKVAAWTGEYQYTIDQVLEDMISAMPAAAFAPADRGRAGEVGFHDLADRPHDELLAQRAA